MWNNYFFQIQKKYVMRVSTKKPLVIRLDGKGITKNKGINLFYDYKGSFSDALISSAKYFSKKYDCYALLGSDEISFIFNEPMKLISDLDSDNCTFSNEIISLFSQYFYDYFNMIYNKEKVFFHAKCFSIPEEKLKSYIKYRSKIIQNVMTTYFLIINGVNLGNIPLIEKINECKKYDDFNNSFNAINGTLLLNGNIIDLNEFLINNRIIIIENNYCCKIDTTMCSSDFEIDFSDCE